MSKKSWYNRSHQFTPYTKADGQAVSDEFDAIQTSFERIPEMRDDGKGFKESPLIPEPTDPMHPVPLKMLTETEKSVNNARDDVTNKAQQVAQNTQSVAANTLTATQKADTATQAAASAQSSQQAASNSENMAHKWAANPVNEVVQGDKYSAYHYATKAAQSEKTASSAAITSKNNADIATSKAEEAVQAAKKAKSLANGEIEYEKILNVPSAGTQTKGIVQLTSSVESESEELGLTAKAGKYLASLIAKIPESLVGYIKTSSMSSRVDSDSAKNVATSAAVKTANDNANARVSKLGDTMTGDLSLKQGDLSGINLYNNDGYYTRIEGNPHNVNSLLTLAYRTPQGANIAVANFPKKNGVIAYTDDVVSKNGDNMSGTLLFSNATDSYRIGNYTWRMPIKFNGDTVIGNEKCVIGFNNNGSLHFGGLPNANQFTATLDLERLWVAGDVKTALGRSLNKTHQTDFNYVDVKQSNSYGGLNIVRQDGKHARFELVGYHFKLWVEDRYEINFPERGGTLALTSEVVSDIRLGSEIFEYEGGRIPGGGYVVTGGGYRDNSKIFKYKPIQKLVNGNWYTISG